MPIVALAGRLPAFAETVARWYSAAATDGWRCVEAPVAPSLEDDKADYAACVLGLRDYVHKNNFPGVVLGMSGGVDSALCAAMAADALGPSSVHAIMLPYRFTSGESLTDAAECAEASGSALRHPADRRRRSRGSRRRLTPLFAGTSAASRKKISRRARAASC